MSTNDDLDVDDTVDEVVADSVELSEVEGQQPASKAPAWLAGAFERFMGWPLWAKGVTFVVGSLVVMNGCGAAMSTVGGGEGAASTATTSTTLDATTDPLQNLPTLAPIVQSSLRTADRQDFANAVSSLTADHTSICDVFFGVKVVETPGDSPAALVWSLTTPNLQARLNGEKGGDGVVLPSSTHPVRAFYGAPCNVPATDVTLPSLAEQVAKIVATESTTTTATPTTAAPVETTTTFASAPGA